MSNSFSAVGKIIGVKFKAAGEVSESALLDLSINVKTGERKKEGEEYPPSFIVSAVFWGKYAESLQNMVFQGQRVHVTGQVHGLNLYINADGEPAGNMKLGNVNLSPIDWKDNEGSETTEAPTATAKTETKKTTKKTTKQTEPDFSDLDELLSE